MLTNYAAAPAIALARIAVALEVTSAIPLQLHPSRECIKSLLQRDAPAADYSLIDGESPSAPSTPTRRRSSSQCDDELPEALATRIALVDEFERAEAAFAPGDRVVVDGLRAKTKYNGKTGVVRGPLGANGRFPVAVNMTQGVETIALKVANLRAADE